MRVQAKYVDIKTSKQLMKQYANLFKTHIALILENKKLDYVRSLIRIFFRKGNQ